MGGGLEFRHAVAAEVPFSEEGAVVGFQHLRPGGNGGVESGVGSGIDPWPYAFDRILVRNDIVQAAALRRFHALIEVGFGVRSCGGHAHARGDPPGLDRGTCGRAKLVGIGLRERDALADEFVEMWSFVKEFFGGGLVKMAGIGPDVGDTQIIGEYEHDFRRAFRSIGCNNC